LLVLPLLGATPALARALNPSDQHSVNLPAAPLIDGIGRLSQQADINISVADGQLWSLRTRPVKGRMSAERALAEMLLGSGARAVQLSASGWRIERLAAPRHRGQPQAAIRRPAPPVTASHIVAGAGEDIVVTASKAALPFSQFAGSVTMMDGDTLNFGGESGTQSIVRSTANLSSTHLGSGRNKLFIRGIADSSFTGPTQSTVGQYFGDVRLSYNAPDPDLRLYDMDGVELLEGPQGTLYGAGSLGGIIRLLPRAPNAETLEFQGISGVSLTKDGEAGGDVALIANVPIIQGDGSNSGHAIRVLGYAVSDGGYIDNSRTGAKNINHSRTVGTRAALRLQPSERFTIDIGGIYQHIRADDAQYADRGGDGLTRATLVDQPSTASYSMGYINLHQALADLDFQWSGGFVHHALHERFDASRQPDEPQALEQVNRTQMWVSEARLSRPFFDKLGWVLGLSYIDNSSRQRRQSGISLFRIPETGVRNDVQEFTAFGQITYALTPKITASAGARVSHSRLDGAGEDVAQMVVEAGSAITAARTDVDFLPSLSLLYSPTNQLRLFARYSQGFRPGGLAVDGSFVRRYRHDRVDMWEAGLRLGDQGHPPIDATLSISHSRWRDIQADYIDGNGFPSTANIGDGRITSLSAAISVRASDALTIEISGAYNHSRVDHLAEELEATLSKISGLVQSQPFNAGMSRIPNVANFTGRTAISYAVPMGDQDFRFNAWAQYVGPSRLGIGPKLGERQGDYVDSGLAARYGNGRRGLSLTLTNPLNVRGNMFALGTPFIPDNGGYLTPLRPRTLRLALDLSY
jgi:outer membrane receptor protein involved in Fe transport